MTIPITIGICAYNEEKNIERTIRSVFMQEQQCYSIDRILVVSSGSTDRTDEIVRALEEEDSRVRLLPQKSREGKNSAINLILSETQTEVNVLLNADNVFKTPVSLDYLIKPMEDPKVGVVGGHPYPTNDPSDIAGFTVQLVWVMHHHISLVNPKVGEIMAFRDIGTVLPTDMQSDEDILRMELEKKGFRTVYAPEASILNRGPETIKDYLKQRMRVNIGERYMKRIFDYDIPTHNFGNLFRALLDSAKDIGFHPFKLMAAIFLELLSRYQAILYVKADMGDLCVWEQVETTKKV